MFNRRRRARERAEQMQQIKTDAANLAQRSQTLLDDIVAYRASQDAKRAARARHVPEDTRPQRHPSPI